MACCTGLIGVDREIQIEKYRFSELFFRGRTLPTASHGKEASKTAVRINGLR
jgi:hypothetical protein